MNADCTGRTSAKRGCKCDRCEQFRRYHREYNRSLRGSEVDSNTTRTVGAHPVGSKCAGCGMSEGKCAWNGNECCTQCTHMFGEPGRKYICMDCRNVHTANALGPLPKRCPFCQYRYTAYRHDAIA